jgi:hypothetical protein
MRVHELRYRRQVLRSYLNDTTAWTVDIGYKKERDRYDHWQYQKNEHTRFPLSITELSISARN